MSSHRVLLMTTDRACADALRAARPLRECEVVTANGHLAARRSLRTRAVDVVIGDPHTSLDADLALLDELRRIQPGVRLIALAPDASPEAIIASLKAQAFACFAAPFDYTEIASMARRAIQETHWNDGIEVVSGVPNWITLRVRCRVVTAERLMRFMTELRTDMPGPERDLLMTAFRELLMNAMKHGAGFDPDKVIDVTAARTSRAIVYHFRDPGPGFDRAALDHAREVGSIEDPLTHLEHRADKGKRAGGFGMLLVREIVDELVYNERGNEVILVKHLPPHERNHPLP